MYGTRNVVITQLDITDNSSEIPANETPIIMPYSFPKNVALGQKTIVTCVAQSGTPPLDFQWRHNGRAVPDTASRYAKKLTDRVSTMSIESLSAEYLGNYTCVVSNSAGSDTFTAPLVVEDQPHVQPFSFPQNVNLGEEASVACVVTRGSKPLHIIWTQDGRAVSNNYRKFVKTALDNFVTLTIRGVAAQDVGNYTCTATNDFGTDSASATLLVEGPPEIMPFSFSKNIVLGQKTTVTCVVSSGIGPYRFEWKHGDRRVIARLQSVRSPLFRSGGDRSRVFRISVPTAAPPQRPEGPLSPRRAVSHTSPSSHHNFADNVGALTIEAIAAEDLGNYTCTVANNVGSASYSATLVVEDKPRIQPLAFPEIVNLGEEVTVTCAAAFGRKPFQFAWTKDGKPMVNSETKYWRVIVDNIAVMTIEKVGAEDVGNYTCTVSNDFGSDSATARLIVDGREPTRQMVTCVVSSDVGPFRFAWTLGDKPVTTDSRRQVKMLAENVASLSIEAVRAEDLGNYTCTASTGARRGSYTASLVVDGTALGDRVLLTCVVTRGTAPFSISWTHRGKPIAGTANKHATLLSGSVATLTIERVSAEDVGNYTCTATNAAGSGSFTAALAIEVEPPRLQPFTFPVIKQASKKVTVHCAVFEGTEPLEFVWLKDGLKLSSSAGRNQVKQLSATVSSLTIPQVGAGDVGNYTCTASNVAGSDSVTSPLIVTGETTRRRMLDRRNR
ncbi:hypothetical protein HPB52_018022 [Rhipicephalus sanguineus]|uniref:Ig-like domain-containing protein n=1 Tax=Rhipicephalus sanguineus TaxID=34632 RepID=A0A9D4T5V6_RHISA|nr:hypothetical protein HPB52_018022 [Rhipicephalus sanguineus]